MIWYLNMHDLSEITCIILNGVDTSGLLSNGLSIRCTCHMEECPPGKAIPI